MCSVPPLTRGPLQASFIAADPGSNLVMVTSAPSATITGLIVHANGAIQLANDGYHLKGISVDPASPTPLANADRFVDIAFSPIGNHFYQLVGLKGRVDGYEIVFSLEDRGRFTTGLLPMDNLLGLVVIGPVPR